MSFLAAASTNPSALETLRDVPPAFWLKLGLAILVVVLVVIVLRKLAQTNKVVLVVLFLLVGTMIGFTWIYERNEPAWATPVVEKLAEFFPSKGAYRSK